MMHASWDEVLAALLGCVMALLPRLPYRCSACQRADFPRPLSLPAQQLHTAGSLGRKRKSSQLEAGGRRGSGQHEAAAQAAGEDGEEARPKSGELNGFCWLLCCLVAMRRAPVMHRGAAGSAALGAAPGLPAAPTKHRPPPLTFLWCPAAACSRQGQAAEASAIGAEEGGRGWGGGGRR